MSTIDAADRTMRASPRAASALRRRRARSRSSGTRRPASSSIRSPATARPITALAILPFWPRPRHGELRPHRPCLGARATGIFHPPPARPLLPDLRRELEQRRPLDRDREPIHRRPLERGHRRAHVLRQPSHRPADRRSLQPEQQLDPYREQGRHRPGLPLRDLPAARRSGGYGESSSSRVAR